MHTLKNSLSEHVWVIGRLTLGRTWGIKTLDRIAPNIFSITIIKQQPQFTSIYVLRLFASKVSGEKPLQEFHFFIIITLYGGKNELVMLSPVVVTLKKLI